MIRVATHRDVAALHDLVERAYRGDAARAGWTHEADLLDGQRTDAAMLDAIIADPRQRLLVEDAGTRIDGCVQLARVDATTAYLGMLSVEPSRQRGGLGKALVAAAEAGARADGATRVEMTVIAQRGELIAWYERLGYAATGERRPFPYGDTRFGDPRRDDLAFIVLARAI